MAIWTVDQVGDWLKANSFEKYVEIFKNEDIDGIALFGLQDDDILKVLSSRDEDGTIRNPTMRTQRKFRAILEEYRKLVRQERKQRRRSSSSVNKELDININNNVKNISITTSKIKSHTINDIGTYSKTYTIEPKSIGMKFFTNEFICSNLTKYFLKKYNVTCHIPIQNQYDTKDALHIKLSGVKENVKNVRNNIHSLLTTIKTKIFNDENTDKKIIRWSKYIYSDSILNILQKIFFDKNKLTLWEKTNILSGYYIVYYVSGQHTFSVSEEFINHTLNNEISYVKDIIIENVENIQLKFRKELDEFINNKKEQQLQYQTMAIIYCQYSFQTEMKISFFGLRNQVDIAKKQIKLLINKHRMRKISIGLDSTQREFLLDNYVHEIKNLEIDYNDDNVKIQIRENIIIAPQYLIKKIKQLIQSMIFQTSILIFQYIKNAFILTEKDHLKLKTFAQNYHCEINKIDIETKKDLIILPKGKNVSTSKYITNESNQFYSTLSMWRKLSISNNTIEIHKSYDLTVDITIISTIVDAIKENIDPKYGNGYFESDYGKRVLFIEWSPYLSQENNNQINESIKKFISTSIKQIDILCTNVVKTIAFATTDWENYYNRKQLAEDILNEMINQLGSKYYSDRSWNIVFLFNDEQSEFFNEFSQIISTLQTDRDGYEQFFYPISTISITLKASGNINISKCENFINDYMKKYVLTTIELNNHPFDPKIWNQHMINVYYKYCLENYVLPRIYQIDKQTTQKQCLNLIGSISCVNQAKQKYELICKKLYKAQDATIQFAARTLAAILNQEDIDEIDSPSKMARSYVYFIENTIDDVTLTYHGIKLDGVLTNLEAIVQNDEVKDEIINDDDGIPLLARCAYEPNLDVETIQCPALRIIDAVSFGQDAALQQIKEIDSLMEHVKDLCRKNDKDQGIVANRILWKTEEESKFISKQEQLKKQIQREIKKKFDEKKAIYQYITGDHHFDLSDH
ncbi:unnamed protein product [Rotaria sp. Silwood1]|nr:unnamed protein product [Rotaria sp. Silwood1]